MNKQTFVKTATVIFGIVGLVHIYRSITGLPLVIGSWEAPIFLSVIAGILLLILSYLGYKRWN